MYIFSACTCTPTVTITIHYLSYHGWWYSVAIETISALKGWLWLLITDKMIYGHKNHSCGLSVNKIQNTKYKCTLPRDQSLTSARQANLVGCEIHRPNLLHTRHKKTIRVKNLVSVMSEWSGARVKNITLLLVTLQPPQYYIFSDPICGTFFLNKDTLWVTNSC